MNIHSLNKVARALPFVALVAAGCQGGVNPVGPPTGRTLSYSLEVQAIFAGSCTSCHVAVGSSSTFRGIAMHLTAAESFANTVNNSSSQRPDLILVKPGDS